MQQNQNSQRYAQRGLFMIAFLIAGVNAVVAADRIAPSADATQPIQVGQNAPAFTVQTVEGDSYSFDPSTLERPSMIITFRGGWCPFCNMHLSALRHVVSEIDELGVDVLFLSGDRPELLYKSLKLETQEYIENLDYRILSDANAEAAIALGIAFKVPEQSMKRLASRNRDVANSSIDRHGVLPVPSVFTVDLDGVIRFAYSNPDHRVRLPADEVLLAAKELVKD
jgi:peroxiredoxin